MSSVYYYNIYLKYKKEANGHEKNANAVRKIKRELEDNFYDEQSTVNRQLDNLRDDLYGSVRHYDPYSAIAASCDDQKEGSVTQDRELAQALRELEQEIGELERKKQNAENQGGIAYNKYVTELEKEK